MSKTVRLSKIMTQKGICSRREADQLISKGYVSVNGVIVDILGTKINEDAVIALSPKAEVELKKKITILLNKPVGYVSSQPEDGYRAAIELIRPELQDPNDCKHPSKIKNLRGLAPAGRLDIDSKGLLVLTQDGRIAKQLIGQFSTIEKEYIVRFKGVLNEEKLNLLCHGLMLDNRKLKPAKVSKIKGNLLKFILKEGRKRQIRRMCTEVGLKVTGLMRVRIGKIKLENLKERNWRYLKDNEHF